MYMFKLKYHKFLVYYLYLGITLDILGRLGDACASQYMNTPHKFNLTVFSLVRFSSSHARGTSRELIGGA